MTTTSGGKEGPSTAMIPMASRMKGKASWASASVMMMLSAQPPRKPATMPSTEPMAPPTSTAAKPTSSDTRARWTTRERPSRRRWSVPRRWALPSAASSVGAASRARSDCRIGSWGASHGAATATAATSSTNPTPPAICHRARRAWRPARASCSVTAADSAGADAGIEEAIDEVDKEVEHDEEHGREEHRALHHRVVAVVDGLDREPPDAGPREDRLRHHGAAEECAELQPRDGDD